MHDASAQIAYVSAECFLELDGCDDPLCNCCCHDRADPDLIAMQSWDASERDMAAG